MKEPTLDEMRIVAAKAFFEDACGDHDYPHKTWKEQYDEMEPGKTVTEAFLRFVYDANKDRRFECDVGRDN